MFAKDPSVVTLDQRRSGAHAGMPSSTSLFEARAAARPGAGGGGTRDVVICQLPNVALKHRAADADDDDAAKSLLKKLARGKVSHRSEVAARKPKGQSAARLAKQHAKELAERVKLLSSVTLFKPLSKDQLHDAAESVVEVEFLPGQTVVTQGDPGTDMFIILEGGADVLFTNKARARTDRSHSPSPL